MRGKRIGCFSVVLCLGLSTASVPRATAEPVNVPLYAFEAYNWHTGLPWTMGLGLRTSTPTSAIFGHLPNAGAVGEVAVAQAILSVGDHVPLPTYADGIQAQENEMFWTTQLWLAKFNADGIVRYSGGDQAVATFDGREFIAATAKINGGAPLPPSTTDVQVLVNVVAVRSSATTPTRRQSLGGVKARYR